MNQNQVDPVPLKSNQIKLGDAKIWLDLELINDNWVIPSLDEDLNPTLKENGKMRDKSATNSLHGLNVIKIFISNQMAYWNVEGKDLMWGFRYAPLWK